MNKRILQLLTTLFVLLVSAAAFAQVPAVVPVQGILTDEAGEVVDGDTPVTFTFYDDADTSLWTETFSVAVDNGFFAVGLGAGSNALDLSIFRDNDTVELGIKVGSDDEMTPRMPVGAVPYAARAAWADEALDAVAISGESLSDLDTRYLADIPADSVDSSKVLDGSLTVDDVANPVSLYEVTSFFCEQESGSLMTKDWCYAKQDTVDSCSNSCSVGEFRVRNCNGLCECATRTPCIIGQPCDPRRAYPRCQNQPLAGFALPN